MNIGEYIKKYIDEHEISQRQFAEKAGVTGGYINMLIKGKNPGTGKPVTPSYPVIAKIAKAMGMSVDAFVRSVDDFEIDMRSEISPVDASVAGISARIDKTKVADQKKTALDTVIDQLIKYRDEMPAGLRPDEERFLQDYRMLTNAQRAQLRLYMNALLDAR